MILGQMRQDYSSKTNLQPFNRSLPGYFVLNWINVSLGFLSLSMAEDALLDLDGPVFLYFFYNHVLDEVFLQEK